MSRHLPVFLLLLAGTLLHAQSNPIALINNPLVPDATAPGGAGFTLTLNGTGFVPGSVVNWNGSPRTTTFVSNGQVKAAISSADIAAPGTALVTGAQSSSRRREA